MCNGSSSAGSNSSRGGSTSGGDDGSRRGDGPTFHIIVSDDAMADGAELERVELQIEVAHLSTQDEVAVTLDGEALGLPRIRDAAAEDPEDPSDVSENGWLVWPLEQVAPGVCEVRVCLLERDPRAECPPPRSSTARRPCRRSRPVVLC